MKKMSLFFIFYILFFVMHAQPDLTISFININNSILHKGDNLKVSIGVKNQGNQSSNISHIAFWVNTTADTNNAVFLTRVSLPSINANTTYTFNLVYPIPFATSSGPNFFVLYIDDKNTLAESNENNNYFYATTVLTVQSGSNGTIHFPYPVLLVHGLSSSDQTWNTYVSDIRNKFGWTYGGRMDFCLNSDGDNSIALFSNDFADYSNLSTLQKADFYTINFDVQQNGTPYNTDVLSNQSAIYKQGFAVRNAINKILQKTGRNKVILLGHSMGGLASREYVQNPAKYQSDGQHHVAKIITLGTPHGGSNAGPTFSPLTPDGQSEAIRDLRINYYYSGNPGVFLFGGVEDLSYMDDQLCCYFYNADVNCNGIINETIIGLNQKPFPNNVEISCNIGDGDILGGDGAVNTTSADLNNYISSVNADTFILMKTGLTTWHIQLTQQTPAIIRSFDEPRSFTRAYEIDDSTYYFGILNIPSRRYTYSNIDVDYYKLALNQGTLNLTVSNIPTLQFTINIQNSAGVNIYSITSNGKTEINQSFNIPSNGTYYLKISGLSDDLYTYGQYAIYYTLSPVITNVSDVSFEENNLKIDLYPNPAREYVYISTDVQKYPLKYKLFSIDGRELSDNIFDKNDFINISELANGLYILYVTDNQNNTYKLKLIKQ